MTASTYPGPSSPGFSPAPLRATAQDGVHSGAWIAPACTAASLAPLALYLVPGDNGVGLVMAGYGALAAATYAVFFAVALARGLRAALAARRRSRARHSHARQPATAGAAN